MILCFKNPVLPWSIQKSVLLIVILVLETENSLVETDLESWVGGPTWWPFFFWQKQFHNCCIVHICIVMQKKNIARCLLLSLYWLNLFH